MIRNQDAIWQLPDFQYHQILHASVVYMPMILLETYIHA
jgi:hypothetical protein